MKSQQCLIFKPGQVFVLHFLSSELSPPQSLPPWAGAGLSQSLSLVSVPPPQLLEHSDQSAQEPQAPSKGPTGKFYSTYLCKIWILRALLKGLARHSIDLHCFMLHILDSKGLP